MPDIAVTNGAPITTSGRLRVLALGLRVDSKCAIKFTINCSAKTKTNKTDWIPLRPLSDLSISMNEIIASRQPQGGVTSNMDNPRDEVLKACKDYEEDRCSKSSRGR
ncbi:hypothetical protein MJO28_016305 [Puccinia striiformis f. sp. tritici]|uniref:Uncharacterized protein n=1 Tax=Puccinia striiformis f. sp. tritici TaxID=168172 RepID=A0ACC0DMQ0_9BASI|nr:hypothetical protein MJO28_016305 [Puccinia striiformis f. sp. tritici]